MRRATRRLLDGMCAGGGGYILAASHTISPETPDENIFAMYEVAGITRQEIFDRAATIRAECESRSGIYNGVHSRDALDQCPAGNASAVTTTAARVEKERP